MKSGIRCFWTLKLAKNQPYCTFLKALDHDKGRTDFGKGREDPDSLVPIWKKGIYLEIQIVSTN